MDPSSLDAIGILQGTDKSSISHGYLRHYERLFQDFRHEPITFLEIGIARGASLKMWAEYFDRATIVAIDIQPDCKQYAGGRCEVEIGSQADPDFLNNLGRRRRPHVIIDDGSHQADHVILTFRTLFPHLQEGGIYVVEDLHFHSGRWASKWRGSSDVAPPDLFLLLANMASCPESDAGADRALAHSIDSVEFFYGGVAIRKGPAPEKDAIAQRKPLVERANHAEQWGNFAVYIINKGGDAAEAVRCVHRAIELAPQDAGHHHRLSIILERSGNLAGALAAAREAVRMQPAFEMFQARVEELSVRI
jgi:hypothetical protein